MNGFFLVSTEIANVSESFLICKHGMCFGYVNLHILLKLTLLSLCSVISETPLIYIKKISCVS